MGQLLDAGLLHADVKTILGHGLDHFRVAPSLVEGQLEWSRTPTSSMDSTILRPASEPFDKEGGLRLVSGNLGRAIVKVSAVDKSNRSIEAPARVFHSQDEFVRAFEEGELATDFVAVVPYQGARANGMPELHKLTPYLGVLQDRGYRVALLTDGRMSGASGRVLAAIHVTPEAADAGLLSAVKDGDCVRIDSDSGALTVEPVDGTLESRLPARRDLSQSHVGTGRELFGAFRDRVSDAESGATIFGRG
jgi:phosphogluconate dehydratase